MGGRNHSSPTKQILPCLLPGSLGGGTWVFSRCAAIARQRQRQLQAELHFHLLLQTKAAVISHLIVVLVVPLQYVLLQQSLLGDTRLDGHCSLSHPLRPWLAIQQGAQLSGRAESLAERSLLAAMGQGCLCNCTWSSM